MNKKRATIIFDEDVSDQTSSVRKPVHLLDVYLVRLN